MGKDAWRDFDLAAPTPEHAQLRDLLGLGVVARPGQLGDEIPDLVESSGSRERTGHGGGGEQDRGNTA